MLKIAVVGAGRWGPNLVRNFHAADASEVAVVVDPDASRRALVTERFADVRCVASVELALEDDSVDAVVIASPTATHVDVARRALEAGKHVLVEKPMALDVESADALITLAAERQRVLMVGHVFLYNRAVREVKRLLDAGELGDARYLSMVRTNLGPVRSDVSAGWDLAAHDISIANYWLDAEPVGVSAVGGAWLQPGVHDALFATLRYPGEVLVNLHVSWLNPRKVRDITLVGTKKMLTFDDLNLDAPLTLYANDADDEPGFVDTFASFQASVRVGAVSVPAVTAGEPLREECAAFLSAITTGEPPLADGANGRAVVRVLAALQRSADERGAEVPL